MKRCSSNGSLEKRLEHVVAHSVVDSCVLSFYGPYSSTTTEWEACVVNDEVQAERQLMLGMLSGFGLVSLSLLDGLRWQQKAGCRAPHTTIRCARA